MALTAKQARFVAEYLKDLNATKAAERAGYSAKTAHSQGPRLLEHVEVKRALNEHSKRRAERVEIKADDVLRELRRLALVDIGEAFDTEGRLKPIHEIPIDVRRAMSAVEVQQVFDHDGEHRYHSGDLMKVKFWDKTKGLELLGKHLKLFTDKVEHSGGVVINVVDPYAEKPK